MTTTNTPLRIIRFEAENFKRLKAVSITPTGSVVQITGANGSGKSSVLDAIYAALAGKGAVPDVPVRVGEESAFVTLDLGRIKVTRRFTPEGTSLVVEGADGAKFASPQTMLDKLLGALTFDPLEFLRLKPAEQRAALGKLVGVDQRLKELDTHRRTAFEERTRVNRDLAKLKASVEAIPEESVEPVNVAQLLADIDAIEAHNRAVADATRSHNSESARAQRLRGAAGMQRARAASLRAEADAAEAYAIDDDEKALRIEEELSVVALPQERDAAPLKQQIAEAQSINARVQQQERRKDLAFDVVNAATQAASLTDEIECIDIEKQRVVEAAGMPVPGLGFTEDGVTFKGLPLAQASGAEQLRVSLAIAMAANPTLRVLRIKDGSLLDEQSLALVAETVRAQDYQLWIERVDTSGRVGIVMEDGAVQPDPFEDPELARQWQEHDALMHEGLL